jgi:hypothetical protein
MKNRSDENIGACYERVKIVVDGEGVDITNNLLDFLVRCFFLEKRCDFPALGCEGGIYDGQRSGTDMRTR